MQFEIITQEKAKENFEFYSAELKKAKTVTDVIQVGQIVINLQKQPNGNYMFPKGGSKKFWDAYKATKNALNKKAESKVAA